MRSAHGVLEKDQDGTVGAKPGRANGRLRRRRAERACFGERTIRARARGGGKGCCIDLLFLSDDFAL